MGDLVQAGPASGGLSAPSAVDPGAGTDPNALSYTQKAILFSDLPTEFRRGAGAERALVLARTPRQDTALALYQEPPTSITPRPARASDALTASAIASGARQLDKPRRAGDRIVQRRIGWQATPRDIIITTAERELTREGSRLRPTGPWLIERRETYTITGPAAERRVGRVPVAAEAASSPSQAPDPRSTENPFPEGVFAVSVLPRPVRSSLLARVPTPTVFDGSVVQFSDPETGAATREEVNVLRMDARTAVVVQAKRDPGGAEWQVAQARYALERLTVEEA